jgi:predicted CXXCH cytochrome family protein
MEKRSRYFLKIIFSMKRLNKNFLFIILLITVMQLVSCEPELPKEVAAAYDQLPEKMDYNLHVKPVLSDKCFSCHGPDKAKQKAGLRLDIQSFAYDELPESPGKVAINPGNLNGSE